MRLLIDYDEESELESEWLSSENGPGFDSTSPHNIINRQINHAIHVIIINENIQCLVKSIFMGKHLMQGPGHFMFLCILLLRCRSNIKLMQLTLKLDCVIVTHMYSNNRRSLQSVIFSDIHDILY